MFSDFNGQIKLRAKQKYKFLSATDELVELIRRHIKPAPNVIHERFLFNTRDKREEKSVSDYVATLRKMPEHCKFEKRVNEYIGNLFVSVIKDVKIRNAY